MKVAFIFSGFPDKLKCLTNNRQKVAQTLNKNGWITRVETPLFSTASLQTIIDEYKDEKIEDFIFFYTGHGETANSKNVLILKLNDRTPLDLNTLHRDYLSQLNVSRKAIVLDACYSGNFEERYYEHREEYLCSSDFDEESYEDTDENGLQQSYFSYYFCEAIDTLDGNITLKDIKKYIKKAIENNHIGVTQTPLHTSIDSEMIIRKNTQSFQEEQINTIRNNIPSDSNINQEDETIIDAIYVNFDPLWGSDVTYNATIYIFCDNEFDNEIIEFEFENIYNQQEQEEFISLLVNVFPIKVTIHFIIPDKLFAINFKQWMCNDISLTEYYYILLHNSRKYNLKLKYYSSMIRAWDKLYIPLKTLSIKDALMPIDSCNDIYCTNFNNMGAYFKYQIVSDDDITNRVKEFAKVAIWQYCDDRVDISSYYDWIENKGIALENLKDSTQDCHFMGLLWDEMRLLEDLKNFTDKKKEEQNNGE